MSIASPKLQGSCETPSYNRIAQKEAAENRPFSPVLCNDSPCRRESWPCNSARRDASPFRRLTPLDFAFPPLCQTLQRHSVATPRPRRHATALLRPTRNCLSIAPMREPLLNNSIALHCFSIASRCKSTLRQCSTLHYSSLPTLFRELLCQCSAPQSGPKPRRSVSLPIRTQTAPYRNFSTDQGHEACRSQATPPQASCRRKAS